MKEIRNSSRNDITILKFIPANDEEKLGYESFFDYLHKRNRFGVVGNAGRTIKDFYIFPLAKDQELDGSMLPLEPGIGLENVNQRPNYLMGLLVRRTAYHAHLKEHHDKTIHYSPDQSKTTINNASTPSPTNYQTQTVSHTPPKRSHTPPKRSYTPPPMAASTKIIKSIHSKQIISEQDQQNDVSYTPPRKDEEDDPIDEPYDPEFHTLDDYPFKKQKLLKNLNIEDQQTNEDEQKLIDEKQTDQNEMMDFELSDRTKSTKNLNRLLEHLSRNTKINESDLIELIKDELIKIKSVDEQNQLWDELKCRIKEFENQLEIKRKATENAFNQATGGSGSNKFDSNVIPGLDFSDETKQNESISASNLILNNIELPENLIQVLEKFDNIEDLFKSSK